MRPAPRPGSTRSPTSSNNTDHLSRRTAMAAARHEMPPEIAALSLDEIAERYIGRFRDRSEEHTSELQSLAYLVCRLLLEKKSFSASLAGVTASPLSPTV